jgi:DNA-binding Lrp family transcriptional regulator
MVKGLILIKAGIGAMPKIVSACKKIDGVIDVYPVFGRFDVVIFIEGKTYDELKEITDKINSLPGIKSTETLPEAE